MAMLREVNWAGPCIDLGPVVKETDTYWSYERAGRAHVVRKNSIRGKFKVHTEPCQRCTDHPKTYYPNGYEG